MSEDTTAEQATSTTPTAENVTEAAPTVIPRTDGVWVEDTDRTLKSGEVRWYWRIVWRDRTSNDTARKRNFKKMSLGPVAQRPAGFDKAAQAVFLPAFQRGYVPTGAMRAALVPHAIAVANATNARVAAAGTTGEAVAVQALAQAVAAAHAAANSWLPTPAAEPAPARPDADTADAA